jgi:hypothetical protein
MLNMWTQKGCTGMPVCVCRKKYEGRMQLISYNRLCKIVVCRQNRQRQQQQQKLRHCIYTQLASSAVGEQRFKPRTSHIAAKSTGINSHSRLSQKRTQMQPQVPWHGSLLLARNT